MKTGQTQILCIAGDPGGASALVPVIEELRRDAAVNVHAFAYYKAEEIFSRSGLDYVSLPTYTTADQAGKLLADLEIDLLLSGTSVNEYNLEKMMFCEAGEVGIPSLAVLDFWSNYVPRFSMSDGDLAYLPDKIAVMDQMAVKEMTAAGIPESSLVITGQPAFEGLAQAREKIGAKKIRKVRAQLGVNYEELMMAFVSQPISLLFDRDELGYDEQSVFTDLVEVLERISKEEERKIKLVIFPHLREKDIWWLDSDSEMVQVVAASWEDYRLVALSADLVSGMTSSRLIEAAMMGCKTVSLQIGAKDSMKFDMARLGVGEQVSDPGLLYDKFRETLLDERTHSMDLPNPEETNAAERVVELVHSMLSMDASSEGKEAA